jgi:hypothetical protein
MVELFPPKEAAKKLHVSVDQIEGFCRDGELTFVNVGRGKKKIRRMFTEADIADFIERRRRRNPCLPRSKVRRTTLPSSSAAAVSFLARLDARQNEKPAKPKQSS